MVNQVLFSLKTYVLSLGVYFSWGGESGTGGAGGTDAVENMDASNDKFLQPLALQWL